MIRLKLADSPEEVLACLDQELFERVAEDHMSREGFVLPTKKNEAYFMILDDDQPIGFWVIYPQNGTSLGIHCNIMKQHRKRGKKAAKAVLQWFIDECPDKYLKLNAEIPTCYPEVYHFTKGFGFVDEGINRKSIMKKGELLDQWRLGITRKEVDQVLRGLE